jgi:TonB family protein
MISFVNYLLESGISLSLFALVYFLFLRKETFFNINRWFLLVSVLFSAILPLLHIPFYAPQPTVLPEITVTPYQNLLATITVYASGFTQETEKLVLSYSLLGYIYLAGVAFFSVKLMVQLYQIVRLVHKNEVISDGQIKLVFLDRQMSPFSFLNYIFASKSLYNTEGWEKMIEHEKLHIRQGHTIDVLVLELIAVFQWFNPFFWMFRRALRENHEFLADRAVISRGTAPGKYMQILINQSVGDQIVIANNFNYSLIKNRIKMISKIKSKKITYAKILLGVVLAASLTTAFALDQKKATTSAPAAQKKVVSSNVSQEAKTVFVIDGHRVNINGDKTGVEDLMNIISKSEDFDMTVDNQKNEVIFSPKVNKTREIVVVAYGKTDQNAKEKDEVFMVVEQMPEYPGGIEEAMRFVANNVKYPIEAQKKGVQGKVYVSFVIDTDGSITDAKVIRNVSPELDQEALRVVGLMPKWKPGMQRGKTVKVQFTLPINFALQ